MKTTKHSLARMSQRGLTKQLIELVVEFGKDKGDKVILNKKMTQKVISEIDSLRKELIRVIDNDAIITAYNTNSYKSY